MVLFQSSKNDFRRKWDKDEYENLAQQRLAEEREKESRDGELSFFFFKETYM